MYFIPERMKYCEVLLYQALFQVVSFPDPHMRLRTLQDVHCVCCRERKEHLEMAGQEDHR